MILTALLIGALIGGVVASHWKELASWVKSVVIKLEEMIQKAIIGFKVFIQKVGEKIKEISKHYSQDKQGKWSETIVTREVPESEIPADILEKANRINQEIDVSHELQLALS
ncbi:hypothetical protein [Thiothrix unzii]|uniref:Uncharacterized protein n=1 Tax=Thiothrix unzii TaxID=111769 RepID=A0A975F9H3_9GAMM|nr:hypothetical protein [Thiothrix unzii]QTR53891.1 hypothetical protein J9260_02020 [Thiothrix unzii]